VIALGTGLPAIPERLLLAHARGEVLFIAGAGISQPAGLPDFRALVLRVYAQLDTAVHAVISGIPRSGCNHLGTDLSGLTNQQAAEVRRFVRGDYDVVLGMLERRIDGQSHDKSRVRQSVDSELRAPDVQPAPIHGALMRLADRGGAVTIVTTNFDLLLEDAAKRSRTAVQTYALGGIPRPGRSDDFTGVLHIHGALDRNPARTSDLIVTDQDFGEFYLRRRVVPDLIYDAARLFNLVLVGYSANDPPMRYLLNAVAADGTRFDDLKERFTFVGTNAPDPVALEDWKSRGITPIPYNAANGHSALFGILERWAALSAINGKRRLVDAEVKRIVRTNRGSAIDADRDLFDHLIRRSDSNEHVRLSALASKQKADLGWLDAIAAIATENDREPPLMRPRWANLNKVDRATFHATTTFLIGRLEERTTVDWALQLKLNDTIKRLALLELIDSRDGRKISEPWRSAWRLIEESWNNPAVEGHALTGAYDAQDRLRAGERSGSLITAIVKLVAPLQKIEPFSGLHLHYRKLPRRPKKVEDLFSTGLTSGRIVDPGVLELDGLTDRSFLLSLAHVLEAAVVNGLYIARRIGWDGEFRLWKLGQLHRVYYVPADKRADREHEPDEFHQGIAPSVKLLHAVVSRLVDIDTSSAVQFARRWKLTNSPVHTRLWAALSRDSRVTPTNEVGALLLSLDDRRFWNLGDYPEIAELRAMRFGELDPHEQAVLTARIRKYPPRNQWSRKANANRVKNARRYWAVRELRRIEITGALLPKRDKAWLDAMIHEFPDLAQMSRLDEGFLDTPKARFVPPNPDSRYDLLAGKERLKALEAALSSARGGWDDDHPAIRAADWIRLPENPVHVLVDLEYISDGGAAFPKVWERFGWAHSPAMEQGEDATQLDLPAESARVLSLIDKLPEATVRQAIDGVSHWLSEWKRQVVVLPEGLIVWLKLWPIAVEVTNAQQPVEEEVHLNTVAQSSDDSEQMDLDTLNTPAGELVGVFLAACPELRGNDRPFDVDSAPRKMRDAIITTIGRSGLIARHRMIEFLPYFLRADPDWTREYLITPLIADNSETIALWRAVARQTRFTDVLKIIGDQMADRATDRRLGRETQRSLVFSLVIECLHAFREQREPAVPFARIQQMIRSIDDEIRTYGAEAIQHFILVSASHEEGQARWSPEQLFRSAAAPFLLQVWPQERSLATPGVSQAIADLPATAQGAFAEAVDAIERFLVPFDCWSMLDYGLSGKEDDRPNLSTIDNHEKAAAFLRLLDLTIRTSEGSVIPYDLADALDQIRKIAPNIAENQAFRRLATAARWG
jgi:hypothetical protein